MVPEEPVGTPTDQAVVPPAGLAPYAAGTVRLISAHQQDLERRRRAEAGQQRPAIQDIAAYVRKAFDEAKSERNIVEERMFESLRQRRGEYSDTKLREIRKQGGSEIYMMLTSVKCRAAASWLRDSLLGEKSAKPWTLDPTPVPDLPPQAMQAISNRVMLDVQSFLSVGGFMPSPEMIENAEMIAADRLRVEQQNAAKKMAARMEEKMEDQLMEGRFHKALDQFIDDLVTFPSAFLKGPVIRNREKLQWLPDGSYAVGEDLKLEWERVNPLYIYPSPNAEFVDDGYLIERHKLSRGDLAALIGVEGYDEDAIRTVLDEYGRGGLREWLNVDSQMDSKESVHTSGVTTPAATIDALQFWGDIPARMLIEWGMPEEQFEDRDIDYAAEVWLIGNWVIKAVLNPDPLKRRPYYKASYEEVPGNFWGHGVTDLVRDTQQVCNAAARSLVNNMAMASGPQVWMNLDRMPPGDDIDQLIPWKIHQTVSDPMGTSGPPMGFFQPNSLANELMAVYEKYSILADEYSGVPRYMTGTEGTPGAGRTASGLSMMINNAGKAIKQVLSNIDVNVLTPLLEYLYYHNMRYSDDPELKGDVCVIARGASGIVAKEAAQVRLNEFLNMVIANPTVTQIVGPEGVASLLREAMKVLEMDTEKVIPSEEAVRAQQLALQNAQRQMLMQQQMLAQQQAEEPVETINFNRGPDGEILGANVMQGNGQALMDGGPVTDMFQPISQ